MEINRCFSFFKSLLQLLPSSFPAPLQFYYRVALWLTERELPRTQTEFDDSVTLKLYLLQFVNYYSSIFYIAFVKGHFAGRPGDYQRNFGLRFEQCGIHGCLMELSLQLAIIMVGRQLLMGLFKLVRPRLQRWLQRRQFRRRQRSTHTAADDAATAAATTLRLRLSQLSGVDRRMVADLSLLPWREYTLFVEFLDMVIQFGFVTIFVAAFPLAPLFALINNVAEIRMDARKLLVDYRRPVMQRVRNIGVWLGILDTMAKISVVTNGLIIAFGSDFVPRLVYRSYWSPDGSLAGYVNSSLSLADVADFEEGTAPVRTRWPELQQCRYADWRNGPRGQRAYERNDRYYTVLAFRLLFVLCFENAVALVMMAVGWCLPKVSVRLREQIKREAFLTNEIILKHERRNTGEETGDVRFIANSLFVSVTLRDRQDWSMHYRFYCNR